MKGKIKMKKLILICCVLLLEVIVDAQQTKFPKLAGPYLGQKPPGMTPEHFGVGIIDSNERVFAITRGRAEAEGKR